MITKTINNVTMTLKAACYWGELCDVAIMQRWTGTRRDVPEQWIELTADEAETLIVEMQAAITEARRIEAEYVASQADETEAQP